MILKCILLVLGLTFVAAFWEARKCRIGYMYTGRVCQRCPYPTHGYGCKQQCICKPYFCSHIKGCQLPDRCPDGFAGKYCDKQCSYPQYGIGCQQSCVCSKQRCNVFTGCQFTKTVNKNQKPHQTNPFSTDVSNAHTTKIVDDVSRESRNKTSITPVIPGIVSEDRSTTRFENTDFTEQVKISAGINKTELKGEPIQQLGVSDKLNKESNANLHDVLREKKWVKLCIVLFGIMVFLLLIAHIVLSIIQCPSGNRK